MTDMDGNNTSSSTSSSDEDVQSPTTSPTKASPVRVSRKTPPRSPLFMSGSEYEYDELDEDYLWKYGTSADSSKDEQKLKALNIEVMKRLQTKNRTKAKRLRMLTKPLTPTSDADDGFKLSPELKVGDFLSGDYTREIELKNSLLRDVCGLWKSKDLSDVTIECSDGSIQAHKLFLSARSDVFRAMFESGMSEASSNVVKIEDIKVQTMNILLQYVYTGRVCPLTASGMTDLIIAADKYQMNKLKDACFMELVRKMNPKNIGDIVLLAHSHNCSIDVKLSIQKYLISERKELWKVPEFREMSEAHPKVFNTFLFEDFTHAEIS